MENIKKHIDILGLATEVHTLCCTVAPHCNSTMEYEEDDVQWWSTICKEAQQLYYSALNYIEQEATLDELRYAMQCEEAVNNMMGEFKWMHEALPYNYILYPSKQKVLSDYEYTKLAEGFDQSFGDIYDVYRDVYTYHILGRK
ncbi:MULTISPECIES: hypothetical protein [Aeromonas]|uniref:hypothetical protein n=1 Tax=Aeromonas TaxID=642 RepID=UPI000F7AE5C3|nr:hypothetical protein [Aeromonas salmonicida]RSM32301.1 hypothetical protein C5B78_01045 [Aeromonas salmonicida]